MKQTKSLFINPFLWLSGIIMGICYAAGVIPDMMYRSDTDFLYFFEVTTAIGVVMHAIPLLTVLAYGLQFSREWESGYYRMKMIRAGKVRYWLGHVGRAYLSGCLVVAAGILILILTGIAIRKEFCIRDGIVSAMPEESWFAELIRRGKGEYIFTVKVILQILVGGLWPVLAAAVSVFIRNPYFSLIFPFGSCLMADILAVITQNSWITTVMLYYQSYNLTYMADNGTMWILGEIVLLLLAFSLLLFWGIERRLHCDG